MSSDDPFLTKKQYKHIDQTIQRIIARDGVDRKTLDEVFDLSTLLSIEKLISHKIIDYIDFPISSGKEGNVFLAHTPEKKIVAVKIYRISTATFKHMTKYIQGDPRFQSLHKSRRDIIYAWTSKEFKNLQILEDIKVRAPRPIKKINNVVVMEFIGTGKQPAPLLKNSIIKDPEKTYITILKAIKKMYQKGHLVHCDLSPFNILYHKQKPYIIDLGQAVLFYHPDAKDFLKRDIDNICTFFKKYQITCDPKEIFETLTKQKW